jgi:hypothetical protein
MLPKKGLNIHSGVVREGEVQSQIKRQTLYTFGKWKGKNICKPGTSWQPSF